MNVGSDVTREHLVIGELIPADEYRGQPMYTADELRAFADKQTRYEVRKAIVSTRWQMFIASWIALILTVLVSICLRRQTYFHEIPWWVIPINGIVVFNICLALGALMYRQRRF
jgi:hypothetical protein